VTEDWAPHVNTRRKERVWAARGYVGGLVEVKSAQAQFFPFLFPFLFSFLFYFLSSNLNSNLVVNLYLD
jgi:hypothetical protein